MRDINESRFYLAEAGLLDGDKWVGKYAAPGTEIYLVHNEDGTIYFGNEFEAVMAARESLIEFLNHLPSFTSKGERYAKIKGATFAGLMAKAKVGRELLAFILGTKTSRIYKWIRDEEDVPHMAYLLLSIFVRFNKTMEFAEKLTEHVTTTRVPRKYRMDHLATADSPPLTADSE